MSFESWVSNNNNQPKSKKSLRRHHQREYELRDKAIPDQRFNHTGYPSRTFKHPIYPATSQYAASSERYRDVEPARFNNPIFGRMVTNAVASMLVPRRKITSADIQNIVSFIASMNPRLYKNTDDDTAAFEIATAYIQRTIAGSGLGNSAASTLEPEIDHKEMLIYEMRKEHESETDSSRTKFESDEQVQIALDPRIPRHDISSILGRRTAYDVLRLVNPKALYSDAYVPFDSRYRVNDGYHNAHQWNVGVSMQRTQGSTSLPSQVKQVVCIEFPSTFKLPIPERSIGSTQRNQWNIELIGIEGRANEDQEGRRFHFTCDSVDDPTGNFLLLTPRLTKFTFDPLLTRFDLFGFRLYDPYTAVPFAVDRFRMQVTTGNPTVLTLVDAPSHEMVTGDVLYIENFTTTNEDADRSVISRVNQLSGYQITSAALPTNILQIPVDTSAVTLPPTLVVTGILDKRRYNLSIKVEYLPGKTQHP
jgi:hypothetical protein